jgi:hypothetical protein
VLKAHKARPSERPSPGDRPSGSDPRGLEERLRSLQERFARGDFDTAELETRIARVLQSFKPRPPKSERMPEWEQWLIEAESRHKRWTKG